MALFGAIEGGGTKWICGVGTSPEDLKTVTIPTTSPAETLAAAAAFFSQQPIVALGIATFGPLDLRPGSPQYGHITTTPKAAWTYTDVAGYFARTLRVPVGFDTDVNGAALGESRWGAARELTDFIYLTVGTGIGGGAMVNGRLLHGNAHPEMGHLAIPHDFAYDPYAGNCPFHGDCLEGLACGPSIEQRWGVPGEELPPEHRAWVMEAHYLTWALQSLVCTLSPQRIVMGGGVMRTPGLMNRVELGLESRLNGYVELPSDFLLAPGLGDRSGICGALVLAERALKKQ